MTQSAPSRRAAPIFDRLLQHALAAAGALGLTLAFFLILPLIQAITTAPAADLILLQAETANVPPPPPPEEEKPKPEEEPEEKPPALEEEAPPLDLAQLELALNLGAGTGLGVGDMAVRIETLSGSSGEADPGLFSAADLDQRPRVVYQPSPVLDAKVRQKAPGTVQILFIVDERGRVENPIVQSSTDPIFEAPALTAVRQWKFEPGRRGGQPVRFRMRVPITFPQGG